MDKIYRTRENRAWCQERGIRISGLPNGGLIQNIALESLAAQLPMPILFESRRKRIQRFLSLPSFTVEKIWLPIVKTWLEETFTAKSVVYNDSN